MPRIANAATDSHEQKKIEITEEMIEAGIKALLRHRACDPEDTDAAVCAVFTAMVAESPILRNWKVVGW